MTSLLLGSGIPGIIDAPVQDNPNDPKNQHAQDVYNHAAIQVPTIPLPIEEAAMKDPLSFMVCWA